MREFIFDERGAASIEVAIVTAVLVAIALLFKEQLLEMAKAIAEKILG